MIDEIYLKSAVNIRRKYLKISNNMSLYHEKAVQVVKTLEDSVKKIEAIQEDIKKNSKTSTEGSITKILEVINEVEDEGKRLESLVEPMNVEIEKLSKEENELYRVIKEKHSELSDEDILKCVQDRLEKEGI